MDQHLIEAGLVKFKVRTGLGMVQNFVAQPGMLFIWTSDGVLHTAFAGPKWVKSIFHFKLRMILTRELSAKRLDIGQNIQQREERGYSCQLKFLNDVLLILENSKAHFF